VAGNEGRTGIAGHRHGTRTRSLAGTFGPIEIVVPRARLNTLEGKRLKHRAVADSLEEAGDRPFTFYDWRRANGEARGPPMRSNDRTRSSSEGSRRRPWETAAMLFWALLASGQVNMRKVDGWQTLHKAHRSANRHRNCHRYFSPAPAAITTMGRPTAAML
jgi:hypothetical protein